ncbi:MAG: MBL fold metallo-hydrolase [Bacillota bacterium]
MKKFFSVLTLGVLILIFSCYVTFGEQANSKADISIKWFGHASFGISDNEGMKIVTDPYGEGLGYNFPKVSTNILTVSHQHYDHNYIEALQEYACYIRGVGEFSSDNIDVKGIASYHDEEKGALRGPNNIYTFKIDKVRICHLGDLGHLLTKEEILDIGRVDILMIPVGGLYTIDAQNAAKVIEQIDPKIVIPMHYKTEVLPEDFGAVDKVDKFLSRMKGWKVEKLDVLEINESQLKQLKDKTIVLLSYK